jgi:hypothetical protein
VLDQRSVAMRREPYRMHSARVGRFYAALTATLCSVACGTGQEVGAVPAAGNGDPPAFQTHGRYPDACRSGGATRLLPCSQDPDPCGLRSGYAGDEYCLQPPPPGRGIQLHVGPANYTDLAELEPYLVQPGQDLISYLTVPLPANGPVRYSYVKLSMRPGAHHLINTVITGQPIPGFSKSRTDCGGQFIASFPSSNAPILESPPQGVPAPENEGLAAKLPSGASLCLDYHRYNDRDAPALTEAWYNIWFAESVAPAQLVLDTVISAGPFEPIPAHARLLLSATTTVSGQGHILSLLGHHHVAVGRLSVSINDALVYDSYDWSDPHRFQYDSLTLNPALSPATRHDGAYSGSLAIQAGDQLRVECEVYNPSNSPMAFGGDLVTNEMCVLLMSSIGSSLLLPAQAQRTDLPP